MTAKIQYKEPETPTYNDGIIWSRSKCLKESHRLARWFLQTKQRYKTYKEAYADACKYYMKYCSNAWRERRRKFEESEAGKEQERILAHHRAMGGYTMD